jgi:hypothetical protein
MATVQEVLAWADEVCAQALAEARTGDTGLVNRLGANSSLKMYFDNVYANKTMQPAMFPAYYAGHFKELTRLHEEYQRDLAQADAVSEVGGLKESLEELKLLVDKQAQMLADLTAAQKQPLPAKKTPAKVEPEVAEPEASAESEA